MVSLGWLRNEVRTGLYVNTCSEVLASTLGCGSLCCFHQTGKEEKKKKRGRKRKRKDSDGEEEEEEEGEESVGSDVSPDESSEDDNMAQFKVTDLTPCPVSWHTLMHLCIQHLETFVTLQGFMYMHVWNLCRIYNMCMCVLPTAQVY